jgi:hypothetical protein
MQKLALTLIAFTVAFVGCAADESAAPDETQGDQADVIGTYSAVTPVEFGQALLDLPTLAPVLAELRTANENPGEAVLDAIAAADVGALSTLFDSLPAGVRTELISRLNVVLDPAKGDIATFATTLEKLIVAFEIHNEIRILKRQSVTGITDEEHQLRKLVFLPGDNAVAIDIADAIDSGHGRISSDGDASLDDSDFQLPLGPLVSQAAAKAVFPLVGATDLAGALNALIDCDALGGAVEQAVTFVDARARCREALASLAARATMELEQGSAAVVIEVSDAQGKIGNGAITGGTWTWNFAGAKELTLPLEAKKQ